MFACILLFFLCISMLCERSLGMSIMVKITLKQNRQSVIIFLVINEDTIWLMQNKQKENQGREVMRNVIFDFNYVVKGDIIALLLCMVVHALLRSTYTIKKTNFKTFKIGNHLVGVAAVASMIYHTLIAYISEETVFFIYAFRILTYVSLIGTYICFCAYIKNLVEMSKKYEKLFDVTIYGMGVLFVILEIVGPFFKMGFYIDENLQICQNYYTDFFRYFYVYYSISFVVLLLVYRKKFIAKMFNCICEVMVISFGLMCYQAEFMETSYTVVSFVLPIVVVLCLFHYNAYDVETGTLDQYAFRQYVSELHEKNKNFSLIFLSLPDISQERLKEFSKDLLRRNDSFFEGSCCFRLEDKRVVLVYQKEKNTDFDNRNTRLYLEFLRVRKNNDYYIVMMDSNPELGTAQEYLAYCQFVETCIPINSYKTCTKELLDNYIKSRHIFRNLKDIYEKDDLNDPRVKVYCQPVLNTATNRFSTAEALMRLELPEIGMVFPDQFIPVAEKNDFIHVLSKIILHKTCQTIKKLEDENYIIDRVSINFSVQELHMENFCEEVISIIKENGVAFPKIAIELTETKNEKDFLMMKDVIENLQEKNIKFYLDDFGTGYSNFERIIGLPIDIIKFDRSLTILASKNDESKFMVGSFSEIFKKADYQILFEGVEDEHDETQCIDMNAQYLQGYKYSKPIPIEQLKNFLDKKE